MNWESVAKKGGAVSSTGYVSPWEYSTPQEKPTYTQLGKPSEGKTADKPYSFAGAGDYFSNISPWLAPKEEPSNSGLGYKWGSPGNSSRGGSGSPTTSYSSDQSVPSMNRPSLPGYDIPERDEGRVSELREKAMGVPMSRLRKALNRALVESRYSTNPIVRAKSRREALSGYGEGVSSIGESAGRQARAECGPEYQAQINKAAQEYQTKQVEYSKDLQEYYSLPGYKRLSEKRT